MISSSTNKQISKTHITEKRFKAYKKAQDYIKHLNKVYDLKQNDLIYDHSHLLSKIFKEQSPSNSNRKLSLMPKATVASAIERKIKLLNDFHNLSEIKSKKKHCKAKSPMPTIKRLTNSRFSSKKYSQMPLRLNSDNLSGDKQDYSVFLTSHRNLTSRRLPKPPTLKNISRNNSELNKVLIREKLDECISTRKYSFEAYQFSNNKRDSYSKKRHFEHIAVYTSIDFEDSINKNSLY